MLRRMLRREVPEAVERAVRYEMPGLQRVRHVGRPVPLHFAEDAAAWLSRDEEVHVRRAHRGLEMLAVNEEALDRAVALLREIYHDDVEPMPPQVHYLEGAQLLEPVMHFRVDCALAHAVAVKRMLLARDALIVDEEWQDERYVLRGIARLASLLGQGEQLRMLGEGEAAFWSWLSHYAPVDPDGDAAA